MWLPTGRIVSIHVSVGKFIYFIALILTFARALISYNVAWESLNFCNGNVDPDVQMFPTPHARVEVDSVDVTVASYKLFNFAISYNHSVKCGSLWYITPTNVIAG